MRLIAEKLSGERGGQTAFGNVDFSLGPGDALVITGPNGAGKSTLLRVVAGLLPQASGAVRLEGGGEAFPTVASACHYLGHLNAMKPALTVRENLAFWRDFSGGEGDMDGALEMVGLGSIGHLAFGYLSTGQRRRAAIARLMVSHRPVWLLDEPTAGMDTGSERQFSGVMQAHLAQGGLLVAATHLPLGIAGAMTLRLGEMHLA